MGDPATYSLIGLTVSNLTAIIVVLIKERKRNKNQKSNGKDLSIIKQTVIDIDKKVVEVHANQKSMSEHCEKTVNRFDKAISEHGDKLFDLAKGREK